MNLYFTEIYCQYIIYQYITIRCYTCPVLKRASARAVIAFSQEVAIFGLNLLLLLFVPLFFSISDTVSSPITIHNVMIVTSKMSSTSPWCFYGCIGELYLHPQLPPLAFPFLTTWKLVAFIHI